MQKRDFFQRILVPSSIVLLTMILSRLVYFHASATVATISGVILFLSIGFGAFLIYPMSFFRGAALKERVIGCLVTPVVWNGIEIYNVSEAFTPAEALFYGVNILFLGTVAGQFLMMGICDVLCRLYTRKTGQGDAGTVSPFAVLASLSGILGIYLVLVWREGVGLHYFLIGLYKSIFL
jgi:hypothetical protein